jgi:hypothetical protein
MYKNIFDVPDGELKEMVGFYGKKFRVKDIDGKYWVGKLNYCGSNPMLNWDLQVTLDRTPLRVNHIKDIELLD